MFWPPIWRLSYFSKAPSESGAADEPPTDHTW